MDQGTSLVAIIISIIAITGQIITVVSNSKSNKKDLKKDIITDFETRVTQLETQNRTKDDEIHNLTAEMNQLKGALNEKNERIKTLEDLVTNRNPELGVFIKQGREAMEFQAVTMPRVEATLDAVHKIVGQIKGRMDRDNGQVGK